MFGTTITAIELLWFVMFGVGLYKTARSLKYTYRVRLYWEAQDESAAMNAQTDIYTADRLRSAAMRFLSVGFFWLAALVAMALPPSDELTSLEYLRQVPLFCLLIAGGFILADAVYSERTLRELLRHDAAGVGKVRFSDEES